MWSNEALTRRFWRTKDGTVRSSNTEETAIEQGILVPKTPLARTVEQYGRIQHVAANRPMLLSRPESCFYVAEGTVDLFVISLDNYQSPEGRRTYLTTCRSGDLIFGLKPTGTSSQLGLLAVGRLVAEIQEMPIDVLEDSTDIGPELIKALHAWVGRLTVTAARMVVPRPTIDTRIQSGDELSVTGYRRISGSAPELVWLKGLAGALFLDVATIEDTESWFPLHADAWISLPRGLERLSGVGTDVVLSESTWRSSLSHFHAVMLESLSTNIALAIVDELNRIAERRHLDTARMRTTLRTAASVSGPQIVDVDTSVEDDALIKVMTVIARELAAARPVLNPHERELPVAERLQRLAASARLNLRRVTLPNGWWRQKGHPLIAWRDPDSPCALIPTGRNRYRMFDAVSGEWNMVDENIAGRLPRHAEAIYGSLTMPLLSARQLLSFALRGGGSDILTIIGFGLAAAMVGLIAPVAIGVFVNTAIPSNDRPLILELTLALCAAGVVSSVFHFLQGTAFVRLQSIMEMQAQSAVVDRLLRLPLAFFKTVPAANLAHRALGVSLIRRILARGGVISAVSGLFALANLVVMGWFSPPLTLIAVAMAMVAAAFIATVTFVRLRFQKRAFDIECRTMGSAFQFISAIAKLRIAGAESRVFSLWMGSHVQQRHWRHRARLADNAVFTLITILPAVIMLLFFSLAGMDRSLAPGDFIAFLTAFSIFILGFIRIAEEVTLSLSSVAIFHQIRSILEAPPETPADALQIGLLTGRIEVSHVTFQYHKDAPPVLRDVSIHAEPGQFIAIVGPSGSGKSTLLRLLLGFDRPASGGIFFDGQDISLTDVKSVRRQCGVVLQNSHLCRGSIFDNIVGTAPLSHDAAWEAAEMAGIAEEIRAMPMGMFTFIADGATISGGQRQRLTLARALVRRPNILLLDEATSALDNKTQFEVMSSIQRLNLTRIVIAHRLSTIKGADVIYVLDQGRLVEQGRYENLMAVDGVFASMAKRQLL
jgi:NHLM bacteriocin system ABC transporter ATP-binding protein